jgi:pimeloyl-ACP methyl ester carboxylesterase
MERHTTVQGRTVRFLEQGSGEPIVWLHAFPLRAELWAPQLAATPAGWRAIAPDLRGFGEDGTRPGGAPPALVMDDHAHDVIGLFDALDIERAVVGGLSMGGYVAFALWRLAPERVRALVLADTRAEADSDEGRASRRAMLAALQERGVSAVEETMLPRLLGRTSREQRPALGEVVRRMIVSNTPQGIADAIHCLMSRPDSTRTLDSITVPTLLLAGREDELTPVALHESMLARIPDASLTVIEGAGHLSSLEQTEVFNRTTTRFLESRA